MDYYSFTDPDWIEGWVGLVGWPIADTLPTKRSHVKLHFGNQNFLVLIAGSTRRHLTVDNRSVLLCIDLTHRQNYTVSGPLYRGAMPWWILYVTTWSCLSLGVGKVYKWIYTYQISNCRIVANFMNWSLAHKQIALFRPIYSVYNIRYQFTLGAPPKICRLFSRTCSAE